MTSFLQWRLGRRVPPGFEVLGIPTAGGPEQASGGAGLVVLRTDLRGPLLRAGVENPEMLAGGPLAVGRLGGGRTDHAVVRCDGDEWVVKAYRRGGLLQRWNTTRYWAVGRFLRELEAAAHAADRGVATADVLALVLRRGRLGSCLGWLVSRYLPGVRPLDEIFGAPGQSAIFREAGRVVAAMHAAGVDHPDLHVGNIVGAVEPDGKASVPARAYIVDWDRARRRAPGKWNSMRNLWRLWRSVRKGLRTGRIRGVDGGPEGRLRFVRIPFVAFVRGYFAGRPADLARARRYFRRRRALLHVHSLFWRAPS